jgi:hypothetical protein
MYRLIRYEDLVANPMEEMAQLYRFIGVNMTLPMEQFVHKHFNAEKNGGYFDTFRKNHFINSTTNTLPSHILKTIEENCIEVLQKGNYSTNTTI